MSLDFFMCRFGHSHPGQLQFHKIIFLKNYEFLKVFKPCKFPFRNQLIRGPLGAPLPPLSLSLLCKICFVVA